MTKTGWWTVNFDITLEGEESVRFEDLDEASQDHILGCIRDGYRQGEVVMETDDEENEEINEENIREISTPFGTIYIDTWEAIKNPDNKIRLYDSRKEYLNYFEASTFFYASIKSGLTAEKEYEKTIAEISACANIDEFLDKFVADVECTATGWDAMAQYMLHNYHIECEDEEDMLKNEYVNKIGKYYILLK